MGGLSRPFDSLLIEKLVSQDGFFVKKKIGGFFTPKSRRKGGIFLCAGRESDNGPFRRTFKKELFPSGGRRRVSI
jgi:hypothetical protein